MAIALVTDGSGSGSSGVGTGSGLATGAVDTLKKGRGRSKVMDLFLCADKAFKILIYLSEDAGTNFTIVDINASTAPADADGTFANVLKLSRVSLPSVFKIDVLNKDGAAAMKYRFDLQIYDDLKMG